MSERIYLTCHSHNPPLRSGEVGYKPYLPTIRAALLARGGMWLTDELTDFIAAHPHCDVRHRLHRSPRAHRTRQGLQPRLAARQGSPGR